MGAAQERLAGEDIQSVSHDQNSADASIFFEFSASATKRVNALAEAQSGKKAVLLIGDDYAIPFAILGEMTVDRGLQLATYADIASGAYDLLSGDDGGRLTFAPIVDEGAIIIHADQVSGVVETPGLPASANADDALFMLDSRACRAFPTNAGVDLSSCPEPFLNSLQTKASN